MRTREEHTRVPSLPSHPLHSAEWRDFSSFAVETRASSKCPMSSVPISNGYIFQPKYFEDLSMANSIWPFPFSTFFKGQIYLYRTKWA